MLEFLNILQSKGLLDKKNDGLIIVADDQYACRQVIQLELDDLCSKEKVRMFSDGKEVIEFLDHYLGELTLESESPKQPISLVLLDIHMPTLDGIETLKKIKERYAEFDQS